MAVRRQPSPGATDATLVTAVGERDQAALAEVYRRHGGSVFAIAMRVLSAREMAEEVAQDVFVRLWRDPRRFDPNRGTLRSFLLAQSHGRAVDIVRSESARRRRELGDANAVKPAYVLEDEVLDGAVGEKVRQAVGALRDSEREAVSLAYFGGHSYVDVASMLHVAEGTAKSRIRSGLARLRTALVDAGIDPFTANTVTS